MNVVWAQEAYEHLVGDEKLGPVALRNGPVAIEHSDDHFETLAGSIVGQQLSGKAAASIYGRFKKIVKKVTPKNIARHSHEELREAGLSNAKASTLLSLALSATNDIDFTRLETMSDEDIHSVLSKIKGIGPWTVEMFLMFGLGRQDVISAGDLGLRKGMKIAYQLAELPSPKEMPELFERWRPYRTAASWYLWRLAEEQPGIKKAALAE